MNLHQSFTILIELLIHKFYFRCTKRKIIKNYSTNRQISAIIHIITPNSIKDLGLLLIIHMIRADIQTEVNPIVGTEKQSEELVHYLLNEFETDPIKIWESNIFGKSLHELVNEGLLNKLNHMPDDARMKIQETLQKIINEGSGGLICIIL